MSSGTLSMPVVSEKWDVERIRADFPVLHQTINGKPLIYLDNSASSQVPQVVFELEWIEFFFAEVFPLLVVSQT